MEFAHIFINLGIENLELVSFLSRESGLVRVAAVSETLLIWFAFCRYALYDLAKAATCISQGVVDGIGTPKSFIAHKNMQYSQDVHLQVFYCRPFARCLVCSVKRCNYLHSSSCVIVFFSSSLPLVIKSFVAGCQYNAPQTGPSKGVGASPFGREW